MIIDVAHVPYFPDTYELTACHPETNGAIGVLTKMEFTRVERGQAMPMSGPGFTVPRQTLQQLTDRLHALGFRPSRQQSKDDTATAQAAHIDDLRTITHRLLDLIGKPEAKAEPINIEDLRATNIDDDSNPIVALVVLESDTMFTFEAVRNTANAVRGSKISAIIWLVSNVPPAISHALRVCLRPNGIEFNAKVGDRLCLPRSCPTDSPPQPR